MLEKNFLARIVVLVSAFLLLYSIVCTAWIAEDAYITFRVVDNTLSGFGPVWNVDERVQVYTHPLWFFVLTLFTLPFADPYWVAIGVSLLFSAAAILMFVSMSNGSPWRVILVLICLCGSRAFVDYSTSGLENPLLHFLLLAFVVIFLKTDCRHRQELLGGLCAAVYLTRPDAVVFLLPMIAAEIVKGRAGRFLLWAAIPGGLWTLFSLFYYGSPVPNTALAKVNTGVAVADRISQSFLLLHDTVRSDGMTFCLVVLGVLAGFSCRKTRLISTGIVLWIIYFMYIGGDYMMGRFFSAPVFLSAFLIAGVSMAIVYPALLLVLAMNFHRYDYTVFSPGNYSNSYILPSGLADERGFYYPYTGLMPMMSGSARIHPWVETGLRLKDRKGVYVRCSIGMVAFSAGHMVKWVDPLALSDPFLSRLPARDNVRVGHFERAIPEGYLRWRAVREVPKFSVALQSLFDDVVLATTGPLFSSARVHAIWRLNAGRHAMASWGYERNMTAQPGWSMLANDHHSCMGQPKSFDWTFLVNASGQVVRID
jgi:arabinofuranosyltransferase